MKKKQVFCLVMPFFVLIMAIPLKAQSGIGVYLRAGTIGYELGAVKSVTPKINLHGGFNFLTMNTEGETSGDNPVAYDLDLKYFSFAAAIDYYPWQNGFRFTAGMLLNNNILEGTGQAVKTYRFDEDEYAPEDIGIMKAKIEPGSAITPFVALGIGNPLAKNEKLCFFMDIGVVYQGSPDVTLEAEEGTMIYPTIDQEKQIEKNIENLKFYPYVSLGISYQF